MSDSRKFAEQIAALSNLRRASLELAKELNEKPEKTDAEIKFIDAVIWFAGATSK